MGIKEVERIKAITKPIKAVIISSQRSGSTFLTSYLDSHPQVYCPFGEPLIGAQYKGNIPAILSPYRVPSGLWLHIVSGAWRPVKLLDNFYATQGASVNICKVMYNQLTNIRARQYFLNNTDIRVIHLRRANLLQQYVSKLIKLKGSKLGRKDPFPTKAVPVVSIYVSPQKAIKEMRRVQNWFHQYEQLLSKHPKIELVYETMIVGQSLSPEAAKSVHNFLGLESVPMSSDLVKVNPQKLELMVKNYDELASNLKGTEFECFLD
ncbi:MAG: sulfotransferase [Symploca sp. SIO3C6]|uniref:Sulfotransferase n=1 Tax=Symploca sp. SIO1C4 TaxID=2607765 RepID=A0A6B3N2E0_9CYAN|nr:sulfotransferase [Symploca sp. SIO3C6]NER27329.1 sulfotransferase [Symploca sp. SIO1C4]